jgi:hypothetical protein
MATPEIPQVIRSKRRRTVPLEEEEDYDRIAGRSTGCRE